MGPENAHVMHAEKSAGPSPLERLAFAAPRYVGSLPSLILHSIFFVGIFGLRWLDVPFERIMLILTTVVSLEAIYLSILIQMTVNRQAHQIAEVSEDIDEIQEDVEEIQEEAKEISEDVEFIQEDVEDIKEDVEELSDEAEDEEGVVVKSLEGDPDTERIRRVETMLEELLREMKQLRTPAA